MSLAVAAAVALEQGAWSGRVARGLERLWVRRARVARPVELPRLAAVVGVGGPTLGGSYKTPLTLALARAIAERGERVSVVTSGYGGALRVARRVAPGDDVRDVGDEALWLARALAPAGVPVVAGPRAPALHLAATLAPRVLVDALLQASPARLSLSILVVDGARPWGAGACPPLGDLRARREALLSAADVVVAVHEEGATTQVDTWLRCAGSVRGVTDLQGARAPRSLSSLRGERVGLVLAIARPERVVASLTAAGVHPVEVRRYPDHGVPRPSSTRGGRGPTVWLTTPKCATKLGTTFEGRPLSVLDHALTVPEALVVAVLAAPVQSEPKIPVP